MAIIKSETDQLIKAVSVGEAPKGLVYNPHNNRVYCANYNGNSVSVIDGTTNEVVGTLGVALWPIDLAYNSANNKIYCANYGDTSVSVIGCHSGTDVPNERNDGPSREFSLGQNYPNPFNPTTSIEFQLLRSGRVKIEIINILGEKVRVLVDRYLRAGPHLVNWDGKDDSGGGMASGIYFYRLETREFSQTKKMVLLR